MSVSIQWQDASQTILVYTFVGNWTWEELYPVYEEALRQESAQPHHVDVICDMRQSGRIPSNVMTQLLTIGDRQPKNVGITVFVTDDPFARSIYGLISRVKPSLKHTFRVAQRLESANEEIAAYRRTLTPEKA